MLWMANNVGVTLLNKAAFATVDFHYPYFLSFVHMVCNSLGSQMVFMSLKHDKATGHTGLFQRLLGNIERQDLESTGKRSIIAFSVIFSLNIAIGNVSLRHVSVNFNQVMRSLVPAITIIMGLILGKHISSNRIVSVIPVIAGVAMAEVETHSPYCAQYRETLVGSPRVPLRSIWTTPHGMSMYCRLQYLGALRRVHADRAR